MKRFDKYFFGTILGLAFPFIFSLLSVVIWFYIDKSEHHFGYYFAAGLLIGIIVDSFFLKSWIKNLYILPTSLILVIYVLYNIGVYGFFMGFPVFNLLLGLIAGYYYGKRICYNNIVSSDLFTLKRQVLMISGLIMVSICIPTVLLAFEGDGVGGMLEHIFDLNFHVTNLMIWCIIVFGGIILILVQILLTKFTMERTIKNNTLF
jgi:hypothetical protein